MPARNDEECIIPTLQRFIDVLSANVDDLKSSWWTTAALMVR
jgi:hypothetical protein